MSESFSDRVAQCHGYDGDIRLRILAEWGKSLGDMHFGKIKPFMGKICRTHARLGAFSTRLVVSSITPVTENFR